MRLGSLSRTEYAVHRTNVSRRAAMVAEIPARPPKCNCGAAATENVTMTGAGWTRALPCCAAHAAAWAQMAISDGFLCKRAEVRS